MSDPTTDAAPDSPPSRASYLLAGRRVSVSDLIEAGLLQVGEQLTFDRPRIGESHSARIATDHSIELVDGQRFKSPSSAAIAAVGGGSFDGWHAWASGDGTMLDVLRQRLLDSAASQAVPADEEPRTASALRHEKLKKAREDAEQGSPVALSVRDLIAWWGAVRRGYLVSRQVAAELANHSLTTSPDFEAVSFDAVVKLVAAPKGTDGTEPASTVPANPVTPLADEDVPALGLTLGNLPSALAGVVAVSPSATFEEAITEMAINGYSQLPVTVGDRTLRGAVTWESIARARHADPEAPFSKAIIPAREVPYDHHLVDVLAILTEFDFVVVRDQTNTIAGIVTSSDVASAYGSLATPFFLIGEFDQRLRRILSETFDVGTVTTLCAPDGDRKIASFDDLSIGDYQRILQSKDAWATLGWPLDRKVFVKRVDELREIRNDLMHFNPDPLPEDAVQKIRHMITLLREYGD